MLRRVSCNGFHIMTHPSEVMRFILSSVAVVVLKASAWLNINGAAVQKGMRVQREPEWKYAPQANALTWITKTHIISQCICDEDDMRLHGSIMRSSIWLGYNGRCVFLHLRGGLTISLTETGAGLFRDVMKAFICEVEFVLGCLFVCRSSWES